MKTKKLIQYATFLVILSAALGCADPKYKEFEKKKISELEELVKNSSLPEDARIAKEIIEKKKEKIDNSAYGSFTDSRDGQTYKTILMRDEKVWMAENLRYVKPKSHCYDNSDDYCQQFGRLYLWEEALDACPKGWHLPSETEWWNLCQGYGGAFIQLSFSQETTGVQAYESLKAGSKFDIKLGGDGVRYRKSGKTEFRGMRSSINYWSSTDHGKKVYTYEFGASIGDKKAIKKTTHFNNGKTIVKLLHLSGRSVKGRRGKKS